VKNAKGGDNVHGMMIAAQNSKSGKDWKPSPPKFPFDPSKPFSIPEPLGDKQCMSPTSINLFCQCNARFLWRQIYKLSGEYVPSKAAEDGEKVHSFHEVFFKKPLTLAQLCEMEAQIKPQNDIDSWCRNLLTAEIKHLEYIGEVDFNPVGTEVKASSWDNRRIAYLDRLDYLPDGNLCVVDIKPADKRKYPTDVKRQLHFYASQVNHMIELAEQEKNLRFRELEGRRVTHMRVVGYKDASSWIFKFNKRSNTALEKRITAIRNQTEFPACQGKLCKYCEFFDNVCLTSHMELW
jgi:RecB family exonuclease